MNAGMNEGELCDHRWTQHKRVQIRYPHAPVHGICRESERNPRFNHPIHVGFVWIEVDAGSNALRHLRRHDQAKPGSRFQRVDHMEIVGPRLGEVLPWMRRGVASDEVLGPIGGCA